MKQKAIAQFILREDSLFILNTISRQDHTRLELKHL